MSCSPMEPTDAAHVDATRAPGHFDRRTLRVNRWDLSWATWDPIRAGRLQYIMQRGTKVKLLRGTAGKIFKSGSRTAAWCFAEWPRKKRPKDCQK